VLAGNLRDMKRRINRKLAADVLGCTPKTLQNWAACKPRKGPPFFRLPGNRVVYDVDDLESFLEKRRVNTGDAVNAA